MSGGRSVAELVAAATSGDRGALARLLSIVERGGVAAEEVGQLTHSLGGRSHVVGITGSPGAGKSTLTNALCAVLRSRQDRVAVLAIDPSSPFSGGAILGDRVRMSDHATDDGVYIRSMATRGELGGLSVATPAAVRVLDAVGMPSVLVETVGVGQVEVSIVAAADTVVVVVNPGWGDAVQANKAGLMEIADIFVVNKADRPGTGDTVRDLQHMLALATVGEWKPPILETVGTSGGGVEGLADAIDEHLSYLQSSGELAERRRRRARDEIEALVAAELARRAREVAVGVDEMVERVVNRSLDPWSAAKSVLPDA